MVLKDIQRQSNCCKNTKVIIKRQNKVKNYIYKGLQKFYLQIFEKNISKKWKCVKILLEFNEIFNIC